MNLAELLLYIAYLEEDVVRYQRRLNELEAAASLARENGQQLHPAHAEMLAQTRALLTLSTRAIIRAREAIR